jgi:hypothetical protein
MNFHAGPAGIGEHALDPLAFQGANQDVAAGHGLADFSLGSWYLFWADFCVHIIFGWRAGAEKKTHDRFQPWVLVEISVRRDKSPRRSRRVRRRRLPE